MECIVCFEPCDNSHYICDANLENDSTCNFYACIKCYKKYLLDSSKEPHCMSCRHIISYEKQLKYLTKEWLYGIYKRHKEKQLVSIEKQRFTNDLIEIKHKKEINILQREADELSKKFRQEIKDIQIKIKNARTKKIIQKFDYHLQCPNETCKGILNDKYICILCDKTTCKKCYTLNENEELHECDPEQIETFKKIKEESKTCPTCGEFISKISGCDQMFCIKCGTSFSWKTGKIEKGVIHNPHAHAYFENNREARNMYVNGIQGDYGCRTYVPPFVLLNPYLEDGLKRKVKSLHRRLSEFRAYYHGTYTNIIENEQDEHVNKDLRIRYLCKEITEFHFRSQLHARFKKYNYKKQSYQVIRTTFEIVELFLWEMTNAEGTIIHIIERNKKIWNSIQELIFETNKTLSNIPRNFGYSSTIVISENLSGFPIK